MKNLDWEDVFKWTSPVWYVMLIVLLPIQLVKIGWQHLPKDMWFIFIQIQNKDAEFLDQCLSNYQTYEWYWSKGWFRKWKSDYMVKKIIKLKLRKN